MEYALWNTIALWVILGAFAFAGLIWLAETRLENLLWFGLMTMFFYGSAAVQWAFAAEQFPTRVRATAASMVMAATLFAFALFPVIVAYIIEALGWRWSFTVVVFPALLISVIATLSLQSIKSGAALDVNPLLGDLSPGVEGHCDPGFGAVADAFKESFQINGFDAEVGATCAVMVDGEMVVDLWGGYADVATETPWQKDTLVLVGL